MILFIITKFMINFQKLVLIFAMFMILYICMERSLRKGKFVKIAFLVSMLMLLLFSLTGCDINSIEEYVPNFDNGYYINNYEVNIVIGEDNVYEINEKITATFFDYTNGIVRTIPVEQTIGVPYENGDRIIKNYEFEISDFHINSTDGAYVEEGYTRDFTMKAYYLHLPEGMGGVPAEGEEYDSYTFDFSYTYDLGEDRDNAKDFVYFNIIGSSIDTHIGNVDFSITFPKEVPEEYREKLMFYAGRYGENTEGTAVEYEYSSKNGVYTLTGTYSAHAYTDDFYMYGESTLPVALYYGEALTMYQPLSEGYFNVSRSYTFDIVLLVILLALIIVLIVFYVMHRRKHDLIDVVEFKAPDGLTPTEAGYIIDRTVSGDDITSLIVYWASKGYVEIQEKEKKIYIKKLKDLDNAKEHELLFFNAIFSSDQPIDTSNLKSVSPFIGQKISNSIKKEGKKYFNPSVDRYYHMTLVAVLVAMVLTIIRIDLQSLNYLFMFFKILLAVVGVALLWRLPNIEKYKHKQKANKFWAKKIILLVLYVACYIGIILMSESYCDPFFMRIFIPLVPIALFFVYPYFEQYTAKGREYLGRLRGLKQYIEVAEKDMMEAMVKENPTLFYDVLPYAYVLGVSDVYMKKFESIPLESPTWIVTDNIHSLYMTIWLMNRSMASLGVLVGQTMASALVKEIAKIAAAATISNIGDGGGGFSGGGAGGGGVGRF